MNKCIQTIPELLVSARGNMSEVARIIRVHRNSVRCYSRDFNGDKHAIINGILMVAQGNRGKRCNEK